MELLVVLLPVLALVMWRVVRTRERAALLREHSVRLQALREKLADVEFRLSQVIARVSALEQARAGQAAVTATATADAHVEAPGQAEPAGEAACARAEAAASISVQESTDAVQAPVARLDETVPPPPAAAPPVHAAEAAEPIDSTSRAAVPITAAGRLTPAATVLARFGENWTGILGAVVLVAGTTFLGIYTALRLDAFFRFLLTVAGALVLFGASVALARRAEWRPLAGWVRAAGAAVLLFACAASGFVPGLGLEWLRDAPAAALGLVLVAILANLAVARFAGTQLLASLHVVMSLVPMAIVEPGSTPLVIGAAVAAIGAGPVARREWDAHLFAVFWAYAAFQTLWHLRQPGFPDVGALQPVAAASAGAVCAAIALAHHRPGRAGPVGQPLQVATHLLAWGGLALVAFLYLPGGWWRCGTLLAAGLAAYALAQHAGAIGAHWLRRADVLLAQAMVLLAIGAGVDLRASATLAALLALAELLAFRRLLARDPDGVLQLVTAALPVAAALFLALAGSADIADGGVDRIPLAGALAAGAALAILGQRAVAGLPPPQGDARMVQDTDAEYRHFAAAALACLAGLLLVVACMALLGRRWMELAALAGVGALLLAVRLLRCPGGAWGALIACAGVHFLAWGDMLARRPAPGVELAIGVLPTAALAFGAIALSRHATLRPSAILLLGADIALGVYLQFDPVSPLIPGVIGLLLSALALELASRLDAVDGRPVLAVGLAYLVAFAISYALVIVQSPAYLGGVRARLLVELFAIAVLGWWWFFPSRGWLAGDRAWSVLRPWFLEAILAAVVVTIVVEVDPRWWAVSFGLGALLLLSPPAARALDGRALLYSLPMYWVSVADLAVSLSVMQVPSPLWYRQPQFLALLAITLQVAYAAWSHRRLTAESLGMPAPGSVAARLAAALGRRRNSLVYYPLFAGIAVFLYWRFDRSVLTLLWSAEAFVVFVLSAWIRENAFRYVALAGLVACLGRLVLIDMAQADLALRGAVFVGVGLLMLAINAIYNRFRGRFER